MNGAETLITNEIAAFRNFIIGCWPTMLNYLDTHDWDDDFRFLDDWLQAQWELLVERRVLKTGDHLTPYDNLSGASVRYSQSDAIATHTVVCRAKAPSSRKTKEGAAPTEYTFCSLGARDGALYGAGVPFDVVRAKVGNTKEAAYFSFSDVEFYLHKL